MSQPRSLLILLGFVCQGLSTDSLLIPLAYGILWIVLVLAAKRHEFRIHVGLETLILVFGLWLSYVTANMFGLNSLVAIGNGLVVFQAIRMLHPLDRRQTFLSTVIAIVHITVGAFSIADYFFILLFISAFILIPATFRGLQDEMFDLPASPLSLRPRFVRILLGTTVIALFFVWFPRLDIRTDYRAGGLALPSQQQNEIDAASGGSELSNRRIFRVEGDQIGYLKSNILDVFDGRTWRASPFSYQRTRTLSRTHEEGLYRRLTIFEPRSLGNDVPTDGNILSVRGQYLPYEMAREHGSVTSFRRFTKNMRIEYWTSVDPMPTPLDARGHKRYRALPRVSTRLRAWVDGKLAGETDPHKQAEILTRVLQTEFTYDLGGPRLSRFNPVDDFILNEKQGHCERFASALAVMLRIKGIPSRIALGYMPVDKNPMGGFYNIRLTDGHAWTEAWFEGTGWVIFDGTPYGQGISPPVDRQLGSSIYEWIEFVWYSKIVEFGAHEQESIAVNMGNWLQSVLAVGNRALPIIGIVFVCLCLISIWIRRSPRSFLDQLRQAFRLGRKRKDNGTAEARHVYGRMMRILSLAGITRAPHLTPMEFLDADNVQSHPRFDVIRMVTYRFCDIRYGGRGMSDALRAELDRALGEIHAAGHNA